MTATYSPPLEAAERSRTSRRDVALAALAGAVLAILVIGVSSGGDTDQMVFGDGRLHRAVASDLDANDPDIQEFIRTRGTSLRYGRIGLPALLWLGTFGDPSAMPYAQPALMVLSAAAVAAGTRLLIRRRSVLIALTPFFAVGFVVALAGGFAEPLAIAASVWAVVFSRRGQPWPAATLLAVAVLTRENAAAVIAGLIVWQLIRMDRKHAVILAVSIVPVAVWYGIVAARFGHIPPFDPWAGGVAGSFGVPIVSLWDPLTRRGAGSAAILLVHVGLAIFAFTKWRSSDLGAVAAACGLTVLLLGYDVWRFIGDATRVSSLLQVFVILVVVQRLTIKDIAPAEVGP